MTKSKHIRFNKTTYNHTVSSATQGAYISNHVHTQFEIMLFVSGDADYVVENQRYELSPYSLIITKPTEYHFLYFKKATNAYERYWLQFDIDDFPKEIATKIISGSGVIQLDYNNRISKLFRIIEEYALIFSPEKYPEFFNGLFTEIIFILSLEVENNDVVTIQEADETTAKILKYINEHITEPLSVQKIADALFISSSTLCHKFSEYMKTGVMKYVKKKKIYYAEKMLRQGVKPTVTATLLGYGDYSSFYRAYKEVFGAPPKHRE